MIEREKLLIEILKANVTPKQRAFAVNYLNYYIQTHGALSAEAGAEVKKNIRKRRTL